MRSRIDRELTQAGEARAAGNEARARVCARRAAGLAIQFYYGSLGQSKLQTSVIDLIRAFQADDSIDPSWREVAGLLLVRVGKDYSFPSNLDIIQETRRLISAIDNYLKGSTLER